MPAKLVYLQKEHARRYIDHRGPKFDVMVSDILIAAENSTAFDFE